MKKVILLTGDELRHRYFRRKMQHAGGFKVLASYCEGAEQSLEARIDADEAASDLMKQHAIMRARSEQDMFGEFVHRTKDSAPVHTIAKGAINNPDVVAAIIAVKPDLLLCYGSSLIRGALLETFPDRFINVHLGLSPYYRGSGTNVWPLVNGEPEFVGATFMHIDVGIDTGDIIHQIRTRLQHGDTPHSIGNRLIADMCETYAELVRRFELLEQMPQPRKDVGKLYLRKNFDAAACETLYDNFKNGLVEKAIAEWPVRVQRATIIENTALRMAA